MVRVGLCCVELGELPGDVVSWEQSEGKVGYPPHMFVDLFGSILLEQLEMLLTLSSG